MVCAAATLSIQIGDDGVAAASWHRAAAAGLAFRSVTDADLPFLARVYASTRAEELAVVPWSVEEKQVFLDMQFRAQHQFYQRHFAGAAWFIILRSGEAIGRLYLDRQPSQHGIIDIALLAPHRRQGLGAALMRDLLDEAADAGKAVTIHVEKNNPAMRLYRRLGFETVEDQGVYDLMRWTAPTQVNTTS
jgi:ribosomal protein S18 acetylase RimI-like enzyme